MKRTRGAEEVLPLPKGGGCIVIIRDAMPEEVVKKYRTCAESVERIQSPSSFGYMTPRYQAHYHPEEKPYVYSRIIHNTTKYPDHVKEMLDIAEAKLEKWLPAGAQQRDHAVDIEYSNRLPQGGSISPHSDDEDQWSKVVIYSMGQTRRFIIRDKETKKAVHSIDLTDNSIVLMNGLEVQQKYTHEVPKLPKRAEVGTRYSLNVRYK